MDDENKSIKAEENQIPQIPQDPSKLDEKFKEELKKKLEQLKSRLEKFKSKLTEKFGEYILGISLLPPRREEEIIRELKETGREANKDLIEQEKKKIDVFVLVDDSDVKKMTKFELKDKLINIMDKLAEEIDKDIRAQVMLMSELRESCFDAKYEILQLISFSAFIYDPKDVLAAIKVSEIHKGMVIKKFEKYVVSFVAVGSLFRGDARSNDIDVAVVIDDTDVKKMSRLELRDKLGAIIRTLGFDAAAITGVKKEFHIQVYILTDFWEAIKEASPVIFTFLRDGIPLYDRGVFMPWKLLLNMGRIKPSPEAIDMHMDLGERLLERAKGRLLSIVAEDLYYAALNPSQAALMLYGIPPTTPKETIQMMEDIFVKKEKMLEKKYVDILAKAVKTFKDIEHAKIKEIKGREVDELANEVDLYLKRINRLFKEIEKRTERKRVNDFYDNTIKLVNDVLGLENIKDKNIVRGFKKLSDKGIFPKNFVNVLKDVIKVKNDYNKLTKQEAEKIMRENAFFIRTLFEHIQRKKVIELERAKLRIKHGDKFGEVYLLDNVAYIIEDINSEEKKISKAQITNDGGLSSISDSNLSELERSLSDIKMPKRVFIKEKIFEDLKNIFGKDVEVMVNY